MLSDGRAAIQLQWDPDIVRKPVRRILNSRSTAISRQRKVRSNQKRSCFLDRGSVMPAGAQSAAVWADWTFSGRAVDGVSGS